MSVHVYSFTKNIKITIENGEPFLYLLSNNRSPVEIQLKDILDLNYDSTREWITEQHKLGNVEIDLLVP